MAVAALLAALVLPLAPVPAPPFPPIATDAATFADVAPGVQYGDYELHTADGPLSVHVLAIDLHEPTVRIGTALANDRLVSAGETLSSMAARTGAVAGINGDYFDINQTNQPLNLLVQNGKFIRSPMARPALAFDSRRNAFISEFTIDEFAQTAQGTIRLKSINDWPPRDEGVILVTPDYGAMRAAPGVTVVRLTPQSTSGPLGTYTAGPALDATNPLAPDYYLAFGPRADHTNLPQTGETLSISAQADPPIAAVTSAIGGGPLLVKDGAWFADPHGPSSGEFATHMPASGAAITADGTLLLFEIDGRQPARSIGVLQPQFASLMIAFGARTGMQFDGGGSSTLVARVPPDREARVRNVPSDGSERHIADALLVYSDASMGPPARLIAQPQTIRALPGARVLLRTAAVDAGDHTISTAQRLIDVGDRPGSSTIRIVQGALQLNVPLEIAGAPASARILPDHPLAQSGALLNLSVAAYDARGFELALPATLPWSTDSGSITQHGILTAGASDAHVSVRVGSLTVRQTVTVGEHRVAVPFAASAAFATAPRDQAGGLDNGPCAGCLNLRYDFSGAERAAYANTAIALQQRAVGLSMDVLGDGNAETLRVAVTNAINERFMYTIAQVTWHGWKRVRVNFPADLPQPLTLRSIYAVSRIGISPAVRTAGSVGLRAITEILAGSAQSAPK